MQTSNNQCRPARTDKTSTRKASGEADVPAIAGLSTGGLGLSGHALELGFDLGVPLVQIAFRFFRRLL